MRKDSGIALVQVLVMSVLLLILAAGVLQVVFGTHMLVARNQFADKKRYWIEACYSKLSVAWSAAGKDGISDCSVATIGPGKKTPEEFCDFTADNPDYPNKDNWSISCPNGQVQITLKDWPR